MAGRDLRGIHGRAHSGHHGTTEQRGDLGRQITSDTDGGAGGDNAIFREGRDTEVMRQALTLAIREATASSEQVARGVGVRTWFA